MQCPLPIIRWAIPAAAAPEADSNFSSRLWLYRSTSDITGHTQVSLLHVRERGVQERGVQERGVQERGVQTRGVQERGVQTRGVHLGVRGQRKK